MRHYAVPVIVGREDLGEKKILIIRHFFIVLDYVCNEIEY